MKLTEIRPQQMIDAEATRELINYAAKNGLLIDTKQRQSDWIAYVSGDDTKWEAGKTKLIAVQKLVDSRLPLS